MEGTIRKGQSRETGNIGHTRRRKTKTQYVLDTTIYKQCKQDMHPPTNNWNQR